MSKFFKFVDKAEEADLYINGTIDCNESKEFYEAFGIECTVPNGFKQALDECNGKPVNIYIDSYGGDVLAASAIYTMLREYKGHKRVKIPAIAASAASVIAMAGDEVLMSPTAFLMIHDPSTCAQGNITEMQQVLDSMKAVKEGIINAYERKAKNISREKIAELMSNETWLDYNQAKEYGFIDGEIGKEQIFDAVLVNTLRTHQMAIYNMYKPKPVEAPVTDKTEEPSNEPTEDKTDDSEAQLQRYRALCLKARK
nr:MAG TPA: Putative ATP dependent Clp protease [Caudoviricetes sp.]